MKQITQIGSSVEEAISLALQQLGTSRDQVDVEVLQEGKRGFLGIGTRPAEVRVTVKQQEQTVVETEQKQIEEAEPVKENTSETVVVSQAIQVKNGEVTEQEVTTVIEKEEHADPIEESKAYLIEIAKAMGVTDLAITTNVEGKYVTFMMESEKAAFLIGKRGQTLNALQQLVQLVINKSSNSFLLARLDVENYRERRQQSLELLADRMAEKALRTGKKVRFEPMPSSERKIIHNQLANRLDIETYSEGDEPNRYLVIEPIR